ncbi:MAG: cysteine--tRNA ligase [Thermoplasmata archaeon]|nr:MAG: cysteine--tRNA ligase [Thermoplasmata archaeon]
MTVQLYNTLTRKKEELEPRIGNRLYMFVCGITPYDYTHLGHAKTYIAFDTIVRYLRIRGYDVFYIQNVTDIDDNIIKRAKETDTTEKELAEKFFNEFLTDMEALNVHSVDKFAKATDYIPEILAQIETLIEKGYAYESNGNVYFEVRKFEEFGKLSGQILDELQAGARIEIDENKRNPEDFALWKAHKEGEPYWESPWGKGRPGWHIEDTAISMTFFGDQYDIHGGGPELIFPHHDSEIAQAEACSGKVPFVKYWLHTGLLNVDGEKMAKSLGNFWTVKDALNEFSPEALRFFLVYAHYRSPIDFTREQIEDARKSYQRLQDTYNLIRRELAKVESPEGKEPVRLTDMDEEMDTFRSDYYDAFITAMDDDFNTREAIANLFKLSTEVNKRLAGTTRQQIAYEVLARLEADFKTYGRILGLFEQDELSGVEGETFKQLVDLLLEIRDDARKTKNFAEADRIRDKLKSMNIVIEDSVEGTNWKYSTEKK